MEKLIEFFAMNLPVAFVVGIALWRVYEDGKKERASASASAAAERLEAKKEREDMIAVAYDTKMRVERIELEITGEKMPTLFQRTPEMKARIENAINRPPQ